MRDFMTAVFAHTAMEEFIMWGFWEGAHWIPRGALINEDWQPKPAFSVWQDLVYDQWWTDETLTTDPSGTARIRAFLGEYRITVRRGGTVSS